MRVIVAGGGEFGARLSESLFRDKHDVILIEKDEERAEHLGERLSSIVFFGDASDKVMLKKANAEKCDVVFAVTGDDRTNSSICESARSFGVKRLIARLNDPAKEDVFPHGVVSINLTDSAVREFKAVIGKRGR
jgi:trk system potassium uptake protein TrkA